MMLDVQTSPATGSQAPCHVTALLRNSRPPVGWSTASSGEFSPPIESLLMVAPSDTAACAGHSETCEQCGSYIDANGQQIYGVDYLRYWECCGASTASIESKVEQALDLVKNHVLFAVREEIRSLKDEIDDLLQKNERLQYENRFLRSQASQETLSRIGEQSAKRAPHVKFNTSSQSDDDEIQSDDDDEDDEGDDSTADQSD